MPGASFSSRSKTCSQRRFAVDLDLLASLGSRAEAVGMMTVTIALIIWRVLPFPTLSPPRERA